MFINLITVVSCSAIIFYLVKANALLGDDRPFLVRNQSLMKSTFYQKEADVGHEGIEVGFV
jgi:hypothetical protein